MFGTENLFTKKGVSLLCSHPVPCSHSAKKENAECFVRCYCFPRRLEHKIEIGLGKRREQFGRYPPEHKKIEENATTNFFHS
jgi:hypothetical protein